MRSEKWSIGFLRICRGVLTAAALLVLGRAEAQPVLSDKSLVWSTNRSDAMKSAAISGRPMLLYVSSANAYGCRNMEQITFRDAETVAQLRDFELSVADTARDQELLKSLQVFKVPTVIFYSSKGVELFRSIGYKPPEEFRDYLHAVPRKSSSGGKTGGSAVAAAAAQASAHQGDESKAFYDPSALILQQRPGTKGTRLMIQEPDAQLVVIAGDFNDWKPDAIPMTRDKSGWWWVDLWLFDGVYEYKFIVDNQWKEDIRAKYRRPDPYGAFNSVLVIGDAPKGPPIQGDQAFFFYYNRDAKQVEFAGELTNWQRVPMFAKGDGNWGVAYKVKPGTSSQYKFVVDDVWIIDPNNLNSVLDAGGNANSVLVVP